MLGYAVVIGLPLAVVVTVICWPIPYTPGRSVDEIEQRVTREVSEMDATVWRVGFPHDAPDHPLGVQEAQLTMQRHRTCRVDHCPRKTAAWQTLVQAGRIRPDTTRNY